MTENKVFENDFMKLECINGILHGTYKTDLVDLELAKKIVQIRLEFINGTSMPMIVRQVGLKAINKEARTYLNSNIGVKGVSAGAIVTNSAFEAHLGNFFIKITSNKPKIPAKVFKNEKTALEWLEQYK
jgi:hypothetical protein